MEKEVLDYVIEKTHELMNASSCCNEAKEAAQSWLDAIGTEDEGIETERGGGGNRAFRMCGCLPKLVLSKGRGYSGCGEDAGPGDPGRGSEQRSAGQYNACGQSGCHRVSRS